MFDRPPDIDFGGGVRLWWTGWYPDRELNPQHADLPDVDRIGAVIAHPGGPKGECWSAVTFRGPVSVNLFPDRALCQREPVSRPRAVGCRFDPLTLSPSIHCRLCGWHVFIWDGKVVTC